MPPRSDASMEGRLRETQEVTLGGTPPRDLSYHGRVASLEGRLLGGLPPRDSRSHPDWAFSLKWHLPGARVKLHGHFFKLFVGRRLTSLLSCLIFTSFSFHCVSFSLLLISWQRHHSAHCHFLTKFWVVHELQTNSAHVVHIQQVVLSDWVLLNLWSCSSQRLRHASQVYNS